MKFTTLISIDGLQKFLDNPDWVVIDCRFWLDDTEKGRRDYLEAHIPGAVYAHLDADLTGEILPGKTGRHPLPPVEDLAKQFGAWGITADTQVIVYDDRGGMIAARVWWLLRWLGHEFVAVLDGGFPAWTAASNEVTTNIPTIAPQIFVPDVQVEILVDADQVLMDFGDPGQILVDSRAPERFRGEVEPIDPVAGRIPGAINHFWSQNLTSAGHFEIKDTLRGRFNHIFRDIPAERVTFYCGSGVTAAHNVLAVTHSGLGLPRLYNGSWSEWIIDPERPTMIGE
jgi:thiosulfate/3-mercaptopyruvate sulfurtransferase